MTDNNASREEKINDISERFSIEVLGCGKVFSDYDFSEPMEMFVGVTCQGAIVSLAEAEHQTEDEFLNMTVDSGIETSVHVLGSLRATLVFDVASFKPIGIADYKAGIARHVDEMEQTTAGVMKAAQTIMSDNPGHALLIDPDTGMAQLIPLSEFGPEGRETDES